MRVNDKGYVLRSKKTPIKFLQRCEDTDGYSDYLAVKGFQAVDTIREALFDTENEARAVLEFYNDLTLHQNVPDFNIVKINIEYEI